MLLELNNIQHQYKQSNWTLGPVTLSAQPGQLTSIIGPNGSGKSTLIKIAAGIIKPTNGTVKLTGNNIFTLPRKKIAQTLSYLPQFSPCPYNYKIYDIVAMGRFAHLKGLGFLSDNDHKQIKTAMDQTETWQYRSRYFNQLSGGEKQRVLLAAVLAQQPKILLLDEPTTNLDIHHQVSFFQLLSRLRLQNLSILIITHQLNLASAFSTSVVLINSGKIIKTGPASQVLNTEVLSSVYPDNILVSSHPLSNKPVILPNPQISHPLEQQR